VSRQDQVDNRRLMALYYAYGRKDLGSPADPDQFAEHYAQMYTDLVNGVCGYCPSVQDAFGYFESTVVRATTIKLSEPDVTRVQRRLKTAMNALDAVGQGDLANRVHGIFKEVARRAFEEVPA
jgi:hypothetical protein